MSQGELFKDEMLRTADVVRDLEQRLARLTNEVRDLAVAVQRVRPDGQVAIAANWAIRIDELSHEMRELREWRKTLERRQDVLAEGVEVLHRGRANLMVVK